MTRFASPLVVLTFSVGLSACSTPVGSTPDASTVDAAVLDGGGVDAAPDAPEPRLDATNDVDVDAGRSIDAANDGDSGASQPDAARDAAADASEVATTDACVADGGDPSLRFGAVYRRTINDGSGTSCTTSSRCHGRPGEQFDLSSESAAYASLVGVMGACGVRVAPCNLADSYLSRLMHNPDTCRGARHTGFAQVMTPAQIAELDAWILGGAQR
jgi:hypothetical protein